MRLTGAVLAKRHGVAAKHALYRANGLWYHLLKKFPGVLFDAAGYIVFSTAEEYESCNAIKRYEQKNHARVKDGIAQIPGYTPFSGAV
jgi:5-methylcytosine-specific restriction protein A